MWPDERAGQGPVCSSGSSSSYAARDTAVQRNMENAAARTGARRPRLPRASSRPPAPACAQRPSGMAPAAARLPGARDSAYSEAPGRHVSRAASLQSPRPRARVSARRSLHLLPLAAPQPVRNDAVRAHPLPARRPQRPAGGGEADGVAGGGGGGGKDPTSRGASRRGARGRSRLPLHRGARGTQAEARRLLDAGREPAPRPPSRLASGGRSSRAFYPADVQAPDSGVGALALSLTPEPPLCNLPGLSVCPKEKQTVTDALPARASFQPGLSGFFASQTLCIPRLSDVPQGACFLPTSFFPLPPPSLGLAHLTLNKVISTRGKSLQKMLALVQAFCAQLITRSLPTQRKEKRKKSL